MMNNKWVAILSALVMAPCLQGEEHETFNLPLPDAEKARFSREPCAPHYGDRGCLVFEKVMPPVCINGAVTFYCEMVKLSNDGKDLTITRYRIQAPEKECAVVRYSHTWHTERPLHFGSIVFTRDAEGRITACDRIADDGSAIRIFPSSKPSFLEMRWL